MTDEELLGWAKQTTNSEFQRGLLLGFGRRIREAIVRRCVAICNEVPDCPSGLIADDLLEEFGYRSRTPAKPGESEKEKL